MTDKIIDVELIRDENTGLYDIDFDSEGRMLVDNGFTTTILMTVFEERRADESEISQPSLRRGWIGNLQFINDHENGSKLWLLEQERNTPQTLQLAIGYLREANQYRIDNGLVDDVIVTGSQTTNDINLNMQFIIDNNVVANKNFFVWQRTLEDAAA